VALALLDEKSFPMIDSMMFIHGLLRLRFMNSKIRARVLAPCAKPGLSSFTFQKCRVLDWNRDNRERDVDGISYARIARLHQPMGGKP
jgi:hypothetical protein